MITEALELYMEGGRVSYSWCVCLVGHRYGGMGGGRNGAGGYHACGRKIVCEVSHMSGDAGAHPECEVIN